MMRVLQVVKTVDGAHWAVNQVSELTRAGLDVHVALPKLSGRFIQEWYRSGACLHELDVDLPVGAPWRIPAVGRDIRNLVTEIRPDIIHSHFFGTTIMLRYALGRDFTLPRLFQVPGPLHLEHHFFRTWELASATDHDYWIASSRYIRGLYQRAGIRAERLFLSYYGNRIPVASVEPLNLRRHLGIDDKSMVVGNINYLYPPKFHLGQTKGLKRHEDVIDALAAVIDKRRDLFGVLIGGQWGGGQWYERLMRRRASRKGKGRIIMVGNMLPEQVHAAWTEFDLAVHVPVSENCGGVIEPLLAGVPVIAAKVGGLPEVVIDGFSGLLVPPNDVDGLATAIEKALDHIDLQKQMARQGAQLVRQAFDVRRTAREIMAIYSHLLSNGPMPEIFDPYDQVSAKRFPDESNV